MANLTFWVLLAAITTTLAGFQADSMLLRPDYFEKKVYIVYLDGSAKSPIQLLQSVLENRKPAESLVYQYASFNAFAAKLNRREAFKLAKKPGVLSVTPEKVYHIDDPSFRKGVSVKLGSMGRRRRFDDDIPSPSSQN